MTSKAQSRRVSLPCALRPSLTIPPQRLLAAPLSPMPVRRSLPTTPNRNRRSLPGTPRSPRSPASPRLPQVHEHQPTGHSTSYSPRHKFSFSNSKYMSDKGLPSEEMSSSMGSTEETDGRPRLRSFMYKHGSVIDNGYADKKEDPPANDIRRATCPNISFQNGQNRNTVIVRMYGCLRVGKKTLIHRLRRHASNTIEECVHSMGTEDACSSEVTTFLLNGKEIKLELLLESTLESSPFASNIHIYVVVYSVDCRESFSRAQQLLSRIAQTHSKERRVILVANKVDLKRNQVVTSIEGKCLAKIYKSAFVEASSLLAVNIDWLWMEILRQIEHPGETSWVERVVNRGREIARSCEEMVLKAIVA